MRYRIELNRSDEINSHWTANVGFRYSKNGLEKLNYSEENFSTLESIVQESKADADLGDFSGGRRPKAMVAINDENLLSDEFAHKLATVLAALIKKITPAIDDF